MNAAILILCVLFALVVSNLLLMRKITGLSEEVEILEDKINHSISAERTHSEATDTVLKAMNLTLIELTEKIPKEDEPPDPEKARKAKEATDRFNDGISAILDYDGGGGK